MFRFIGTLLKKRDRRIKILVLDDQDPEADNSYSLIPNSLLFGVIASIFFLITCVSLLFIFTPFGMFLYNTEDAELRENVIEITRRLETIQDSLDRREEQYIDIIEVLRQGADTTFTSELPAMEAFNGQNDGVMLISESYDEVFQLSQSDIIYSEILNRSPDFPSPFPVKGTLTNNFDASKNHYGIDIASAADAEFKSVADGTIISSGWNINFGYSIYIQHSDGMVSVYKHCSKLYKKKGDVVERGDYVGVVGNTGLLSSGPHLHFELWKQGIPLNPIDYLIQ